MFGKCLAAAKRDYKNRSMESMKGHHIQINKFKFKINNDY